MNRLQSRATAGAPLARARRLFFERGELPEGLVGPGILRSWARCRRFGLAADHPAGVGDALDRVALRVEQERNRLLLRQGRPILEQVFAQIRDSGSMVLLADASGLVLDAVGDADFVDRADRIALAPGASWDENRRGTNAIGTALIEGAPLAVLGAEHFLERNAFLTCCASPLYAPDGRLAGVLDISGDARQTQQRHTLGLVRLSASLIERRLFAATHADDLRLAFHERADCLGTPAEGLIALAADGPVLAIDRSGLALLGRRLDDVAGRDCQAVFELPLARLVDRLRAAPGTPLALTVDGRTLYLRADGPLPAQRLSHLWEGEPATAAPRAPAARPAGGERRGARPAAVPPDLAALDTGDPRLCQAIDRARRILGRDIPLLIQGESGAGKEVFAQAFHHSGPRRHAPFVALNCAAIPETLIEAELFGYQGGAFTGARREGAPGKILLAQGGTLFLDEIGDMPLALQARLLRVLQERRVTPLGGREAIDVDLSLVCATHRRLRDEVARGAFREDLYYRLAGLSVTLPPLRERSDLPVLVSRLTDAEGAARGAPLRLSPAARAAIEDYAWPGNLRQLASAIRVAAALIEPEADEIGPEHLPEELFEAADDPWAPAPPDAEGSLRELGRQAVERALAAAGGNISAAARRLGISRNTLYRKLGRG